MPRKIRYIIPQVPHHAVQRGNNRQDIFFDQEDRLNFLSNLQKYSKKQQVSIGAYCLMTNHIHLMLYPESENNLAKFMKFVCQMHTQHINRKYRRSGKLWENRYKLHIVDPACEWVVARYIERNPVRARMVKNIEDYEYSSARAHLLLHTDRVLSKDILKNRLNEYREFFKDKESDSKQHLSSIREIIQQEKVWGNETFIKSLEERFQTIFRVRPRGRPQKTMSPSK